MIQIYGKLEGFPESNISCIVWVGNVMNPVCTNHFSVVILQGTITYSTLGKGKSLSTLSWDGIWDSSQEGMHSNKSNSKHPPEKVSGLKMDMFFCGPIFRCEL